MNSIYQWLKCAVCSIGLTVALSHLAGATASTHIWGPSTDVQEYKTWHLTADTYAPTQLDAAGTRIPTITNVGLTVGLLSSKVVNVEIGFDHKTGLGFADNYPLYGNMKVGIRENVLAKNVPAIAIGIFDVGTKSGLTDYNVSYAKVAKTLNAGKTVLGRISLGYFNGNRKLLRDEKGDKDNDGLMLAWEKTMNGISDKLWWCVEYLGSHSAYGTWNVGGAWKCAGNVGVLVGYNIFNNELLANTATLQVDVDF